MFDWCQFNCCRVCYAFYVTLIYTCIHMLDLDISLAAPVYQYINVHIPSNCIDVHGHFSIVSNCHDGFVDSFIGRLHRNLLPCRTAIPVEVQFHCQLRTIVLPEYINSVVSLYPGLIRYYR